MLKNIEKTITSRNNFSVCKLNQNQVVIFGGIENKTQETLDEFILWDLESFKLMKPFVAGESPGKSKGHA